MPPCSLSLLFFTNKIFPTSAAGVCLCFHSQSGHKNPEDLKIPACLLYIKGTMLSFFKREDPYLRMFSGRLAKYYSLIWILRIKMFTENDLYLFLFLMIKSISL
jgi:hypothetical protein